MAKLARFVASPVGEKRRIADYALLIAHKGKSVY
jgi:hypothetical protein